MTKDEEADYDRKWKSNFEREMGKLTDAINSMLIQINVVQERMENLLKSHADHGAKIADLETNVNKVKGGGIALLGLGGFLGWLASTGSSLKGLFR